MLTVDLKSLRLEDGMKVLDLGCGAGRHLHALYFAAKIHAVGIDLGHDDLVKTREGFESFPDVSDDRPRFTLAVGDALRLPFADDSFDVIVCSEVLEHIPDYEQAVAEIARILRPGGRLAVSVPRFWPEWICWKLAEGYHNTPGGHVRIFRTGTLRNAIERAGFRFHRRHWAHGLHSPYWWLQCADWENREKNWLVRQYHKLLVWEIVRQPLLMRVLSAIADPLMGKSVVLYFSKERSAAA
jgi:ubiquinone/menaquinone biosynthesis C-methylase UbiE